MASTPKASESPTFVPIRLIAPEQAALALTPAEKESPPSVRRDAPGGARLGAIEIRLASGAQVRIEDGVDGEVLRFVLSTLSGL